MFWARFQKNNLHPCKSQFSRYRVDKEWAHCIDLFKSYLWTHVKFVFFVQIISNRINITECSYYFIKKTYFNRWNDLNDSWLHFLRVLCPIKKNNIGLQNHFFDNSTGYLHIRILLYITKQDNFHSRIWDTRRFKDFTGLKYANAGHLSNRKKSHIA